MIANFTTFSWALFVSVVLCLPVTGKAVAKSQKKSSYAVVDMQSVILSVKEGKDARATLEKEIRKKEEEFKTAKGELDKLHKKWGQQAPLLSEKARMEKQKEIQEKFLGLRNEEMTFQAEIKRKEQKATQKIAVRISKFVNKIAEDRGFDVVFETNSSGLIYVRDPIDLTREVIELFENAGEKEQTKVSVKKD